MISFFKRTPDSLSRADIGVLAAGLAVFAGICSLIIDRSSIWFDEAFGAYLIRFNFADVARYTADDVHPPLYYWLLKVWGMLFGTTEVGLRSLSVVLGAVAIIFAFLFVRRAFGRRAAWTGLAFMVVTPFFIRYSVEMRMYTMVAALAFAGTYVLTLAEERKKTGWWVLYGVIVGLGMLTHYFSALVWLAHWVWRFTTIRSTGARGKKLWRAFFTRGWILAHIVALLVFGPWIGAFVYQLLNVQGNGFWIPPFTPGTPVNYLTNVVFYLEQADVQSWGALIFAVFIAAAAVLITRTARRQKGTAKSAYWLIISIAVIPPILLLLASLPPLRPAFVDRYVVPSALAIGLLIGVSLGLSRNVLERRRWWIAVIAGLALFGYGLTNVYRLGNYNNTLHTSNNTRDIVQAVRARAPDIPIVADSPWLYYEAAFYTTSASPVMFIDANTQYRYGSLDMLKENDMGKIKDLSAFEAANSSFWYVGRPGSSEISLPGANLKAVDTVRVSDSISGAEAYEAIRYTVL